jgi:hypothetical protein
MKTLPILLLLALVSFGNFTSKANTNFFNDLKLLPIAFDAPPDTIKPSVSLLGFDTVITPLKAEYIDSPIALIDNVDSDSAMRSLGLLFILSNLPKNGMGNLFCDQSGYFKMVYCVKDLAGNLSDTAIRVVHCDGSTSILGQFSRKENYYLGLDAANKIIHITLFSSLTEPVEFHLLDMFGKEISIPTLSDNQTKIELDYTNVPEGIYLLSLKNGTSVFYKKVFLK